MPLPFSNRPRNATNQNHTNTIKPPLSSSHRGGYREPLHAVSPHRGGRSRRAEEDGITTVDSARTLALALSWMSTEESALVPLLARRSYHLPNHSWCGDWCQWIGNNHLLFGIWCHHPWHPLEWWERILALIASISFGLVASQLVYDYYHYQQKQDEYEYGDDNYNQQQQQQQLQDAVILNLFDTYAVTHGMVVLWTVGGLCHSLFDMAIWNIMTCACCQPGGRFAKVEAPLVGRRKWCRDLGSYSLIPLILTLLGWAIYLVLQRASHPELNSNGQGDDDSFRSKYFSYYMDNTNEYDENNNNNNNDNNVNANYDYNNYNNNNNNNQGDEDEDDWFSTYGGAKNNGGGIDVNQIHHLENFSFLQRYAIELVMTWCLYFPLLQTILFSGVLGCLPFLGGRPRDVKWVQQEALEKYQEYQQQQQQQGSQKQPASLLLYKNNHPLNKNTQYDPTGYYYAAH